MELGDIVSPADGSQLRSGAASYDDAVVVQEDTLVLVSRSADMRWEGTLEVKDFLKVGTASRELLEACQKRL